MAYDVTKLATLGQLGNLAERTVAAIAPTFKSLAVSGNRVNFYTSTDATGTVAAYVDFPEEIFLDQAGTTLVENFTWAAATYPGSTNPNLDGKTVLVLAVKGDAQTNPTTKYSFVDVSKLIDTYTAADNSITIAEYTVAVKINPSADNLLELTETGLMVDGSDILEKVDPATAGNVPLLASDGTLTNSTLSRKLPARRKTISWCSTRPARLKTADTLSLRTLKSANTCRRFCLQSPAATADS